MTRGEASGRGAVARAGLVALAALAIAAPPAGAAPSARPAPPAAQRDGGVTPAPAPRVDRPLGVDTPGTLRQLVLDLPLQDARGEGAALEVRWTAANDWTVPTRLARGGQVVEVQLDEQADRLELVGRLPWARAGAEGLLARVDTAVAWCLVQHWGGYSDGAIEAWHGLWRFESFDRPAGRRDAVSVHLGVPGGPRLVDLDRPRLAVGDLAVRTALRLAEGERAAGPWAIAARLDLKAPLGRAADAGGSGSPDAGLALAATVPLLPWLTLHAQASGRRVGPLPGAVPLRLRPWQLGAEASLVAWRGEWALALESRWLSALFERGWDAVGRPAQGDAFTAVGCSQNQITGGLRWRSLTLWLSEDWTPGPRRGGGSNWFYGSNAPDLALGMSIVQAL